MTHAHTQTSELPSFPPEFVEAYWDTVADTLVTLHGMAQRDAFTKVRALRRRIAARSDGSGRDIVYHAEPFDVACRLAGRELPWEAAAAVYADIVRRHSQP